jgi:hypothetical protein
MPYIGNTPADKFLTLAKQSFSTSATTSYTLDSAVSSTQDIALFINNVRQSPVDAYSVSGTALTLTSATAGTDEMYCVYLAKTVGTVSPASNSVTTAMIQSNAVNNAKMADDAIGLAELSATGTPSSSNFLRGDNAWASAGGLSAASQWRMTTTFAGDAAPIASNWEQSDSTAYANLGSAMTESSGIFTFPSTGFWFVRFTGMIKTDNGANRAAYNISATTNNSSYSQITEAQVFGANTGGSNTYASVSSEAIVDVTDTAQVKVRFDVAQEDNSNDTMGSSSYPQTGATFIRLGDT